MGNSFSRLKKGIKRRFKRESGRTGAGVHGKGVDPAGPPPRAESPVVAGGRHNRDGNEANADERRVRSMDRPQRPDEPESVPARGSESDQERNERGRGGNDGKGKRVERVYPSPSTAPISHSGTPDSTWAWLFWLLSLIIPSDSVDTSVSLDRVTAVPRPDNSDERSVVADENKPGWESNGFTTAELLRGVRDSADAFGPLKSFAGGLCFILENYEVRSSSTSTIRNAYGCPQRTEANTQAIQSLAPRVKALAELLCTPVSEDDVEEQERRTRLEQ